MSLAGQASIRGDDMSKKGQDPNKVWVLCPKCGARFEGEIRWSAKHWWGSCYVTCRKGEVLCKYISLDGPTAPIHPNRWLDKNGLPLKRKSKAR